jgi:hypothetical protein
MAPVVDVDDFIDPVAALAAAEPAPTTAVERIARHTSTLRVWIDKVKAIALPAIVSFTFTDSDLQAIHEAHEIAIDDRMSHERALRLLKVLKATRANATEYYETMRRPYRGVAEAVIGLQERDVVPVDDAERTLETKCRAYDQIERQREAEERLRLQAIEDQKAADARARAADAMARVAEQHPEPEVRAAILQESQAIATAPIAATRAVVPTNRAHVSGVRLRPDRYVGELIDGSLKGRLAFVKAVLTKKLPIDAIEISQTWIDAQARQHKDQLSVIYPLLRAVKNPPTK